MKLANYVAKLERNAKDPLAKAVERIRKGGLELIDACFATETDPYGKSWAPVKEHNGHKSILVDSNNLRSSWQAFAYGNLIRFSNPEVYAAKQNYKRRMIPSQKQGWSQSWATMAKLALVEVGKRVYGGGE